MRSHAIACDRMVAVRSRVQQGHTKKIAPNPIVPPPHEHVTLPPAALPSLSMASSAMDPYRGSAAGEAATVLRRQWRCGDGVPFAREKNSRRKIVPPNSTTNSS